MIGYSVIIVFVKKKLLKSDYLCWMPQTISKVKGDFEVINQFTLFPVI